MDNFTDEKLVELAQNNTKNNDYIVELLLRYKYIIKKTARSIFLYDGGIEDLVQEGNIALIQAIQKYSPKSTASFKTFAITCIKRRLLDMVKKYPQKSNEDIDNIEVSNLTTDPYYEVLASEIMATIDKVSNPTEKQIINMFLDGFSYSEIANNLGISEKKVDNTLQKIRKTLKKSN